MDTSGCTLPKTLKGTSAKGDFAVQIDLCYEPIYQTEGETTYEIASVTVTFELPDPDPPVSSVFLNLRGVKTEFSYNNGDVHGDLYIVRFGSDPTADTGIWADVQYPPEEPLFVERGQPESYPDEVPEHFEGILLGSVFAWTLTKQALL